MRALTCTNEALTILKISASNIEVGGLAKCSFFLRIKRVDGNFLYTYAMVNKKYSLYVHKRKRKKKNKKT